MVKITELLWSVQRNSNNSSWYLRDHVVQEYVGVKLQLVILTWLKWKEEPNKAVLKYILHALCAVSFLQHKLILALENLF